MIERKLFQHKDIRINGVKFTIQKLSPSMFLDTDYMMPLNSVIEKVDETGKEKSEDEILKQLEESKDKIRDALMIGIVQIKVGWFGKKEKVSIFIDKIMQIPELYCALFSEVINHTLGVKKNFIRHFKLAGIRQKLSI